MWTIGHTEQLTVDTLEDRSWIAPELLEACDDVARSLRVTGTQTFASRTPADDVEDYLCFDIVLNSVYLTGVRSGFVIGDQSPHAHRTATIAEALAEMCTGAAMGDPDLRESLGALVGEEHRLTLTTVAAAHP